jgi:opacity protein-like surface antigen
LINEGQSFMKRFPLTLAGVLIIVSICALPAQAGEIFGSVGYGRFSGSKVTSGDRSGLDLGVTYGAGLGAHPLPLIGFEFTVHGRRHSSEISDGRLLFFSGNVLLHFSGGLVQPYVVGGVGVMYYNHTFKGCPGCNPIRSENAFATNFGAGMKIFVAPKVSLRPEIRYFTSRPSEFNMLQASIGLSLHW